MLINVIYKIIQYKIVFIIINIIILLYTSDYNIFIFIYILKKLLRIYNSYLNILKNFINILGY